MNHWFAGLLELRICVIALIDLNGLVVGCGCIQFKQNQSKALLVLNELLVICLLASNPPIKAIIYFHFRKAASKTINLMKWNEMNAIKLLLRQLQRKANGSIQFMVLIVFVGCCFRQSIPQSKALLRNCMAWVISWFSQQQTQLFLYFYLINSIFALLAICWMEQLNKLWNECKQWPCGSITQSKSWIANLIAAIHWICREQKKSKASIHSISFLFCLLSLHSAIQFKTKWFVFVWIGAIPAKERKDGIKFITVNLCIILANGIKYVSIYYQDW